MMPRPTNFYFFVIFISIVIFQALGEEEDDGIGCGKCGRRIPGLEGVRQNARVINGRQVRPAYKYPWIVKVDGERKCSGSIINERFILTSAFCLTTSKADNNSNCKDGKMAKECYVKTENLKILVPWKDSTKVRKTLHAEELLPHPEYDHSCKKHDIALVKVSEDIACNSFQQPICLPNEDLNKFDRTVIITGWGKITQEGTRGSKALREGEMIQVEFAGNCDVFKCFDKNTTEAICARGAKKEHTPCQGDSGAALFAGFKKAYHALGVTSLHNENSCVPEKPLFFGKVYYYMEWIKKYVTKFPKPYKNFVDMRQLEPDSEPAES